MIAAAVLSAFLVCSQSASAEGRAAHGIELVRSISIGEKVCSVKFSEDGKQARVRLHEDEGGGVLAPQDVPIIDCDTFALRWTHELAPMLYTHSRSWAPYPDQLMIKADVDERSVSIEDLLNKEAPAVVELGAKPGNISMSPDGTDFVVVCSEPDSLVWINTALLKVVTRLTEGVGPDPVQITDLPGGRLALINNQGGGTISVLDYDARMIVDVIPVEEGPASISLHPDGQFAYVACEEAETICVLGLPIEERVAPVEFKKNEVLILGTIHGGHETSERFDLKLLDGFIREVNPDYILAEIPPDRARAAMEGFLRDGKVSEPRVMRFPEYLDVVDPLTRELDFEIIPTAGWTDPMARFRSNRLRAISADPERAEEWAEYQAASLAAEECQKAAGEGDDPYFVNSDAYDDCVEIDLAVYDRLFNDELGPGGWTAINKSHYGNIAQALDKYAGQGKRFLITYGAGHKGWFLRELRKRIDIDLVDVAPFLMKAEAALGRR